MPSSEASNDREVGWLFASHRSIAGTSATIWYGRTENWLQFGAYENWHILDGAALTARQSSAIDKKMDDGIPATGNITGMNGSIGDNVNTVVTPNCINGGNINYHRRRESHTMNGTSYNVSSNTVNCVLHFNLGG